MTTTAAQRKAQNHGSLKNGDGNGQTGSIFDLDAYQAEAMHEPFTFTAGGQQFTVPHLSDMDWHVGLDENGNPGDPTVLNLLRAGLGDQWGAFNKCKINGKPVSNAGIIELCARWRKHSGTDLGEEGASAGS